MWKTNCFPSANVSDSYKIRFGALITCRDTESHQRAKESTVTSNFTHAGMHMYKHIFLFFFVSANKIVALCSNHEDPI